MLEGLVTLRGMWLENTALFHPIRYLLFWTGAQRAMGATRFSLPRRADTVPGPNQAYLMR